MRHFKIFWLHKCITNLIKRNGKILLNGLTVRRNFFIELDMTYAGHLFREGSEYECMGFSQACQGICFFGAEFYMLGIC